MNMDSSPQIYLINAYPLETGGSVERSLSWLASQLRIQGSSIQFIWAGDDTGVRGALDSGDLLILGDLGGLQGELMLAAAITGARGPVLLLQHGFPFCAYGTCACVICPITHRCPHSDRVAVYRELTARAKLVVYQSPLHCQLSERFVGGQAACTLITPPPCLPSIPATPAAFPDRYVAFPHPNDPVEWQRIATFCLDQSEIEVDIYAVPPRWLDLPTNAHLHAPVSFGSRVQVLGQYGGLLQVSGRPLPFGQEVAAMLIAGRRVEVRADIGFYSYHWSHEQPDEIGRQLTIGRERLVQAVQSIGDGAMLPLPSRSFGSPVVAERPLLWVHGVGLGDSINLLPFIKVLQGHTQKGQLTIVMPRYHLNLLDDQIEAIALPHEEFDIEQARGRYDLIVEIIVSRGQAYAGDILDERWVQLELAHQPHAYGTIHENLLSLLARSGVAHVPERPRIRIDSGLRQRACERLADAGINPAQDLVIAVQPGAGGMHKRWPAERFAALCYRLRKELNAKLLLVTGPDEEALRDTIVARGPAIDLVSHDEPLKFLAALLSHCTGHVSNDSGVAHLAGACDVPGAVLFGPSISHIWGPTHPLSVVVSAHRRNGTRAWTMRAITVSQAFAGILRFVAHVATERPQDPARHVIRAPTVGPGPGRSDTWAGLVAEVSSNAGAGEDQVASLLDHCGQPVAWGTLAHRYSPALLDLLVASALIVPAWAATLDVSARIFRARSLEGAS